MTDEGVITSGMYWKIGAAAFVLCVVAAVIWGGGGSETAPKTAIYEGATADRTLSRVRRREVAVPAPAASSAPVAKSKSPASSFHTGLLSAPPLTCAAEPERLVDPITIVDAPRIGATMLVRLESGAKVYRCGSLEGWRKVMYPRTGGRLGGEIDCASKERSFPCPYGWVFGDFRTKGRS